MYIIDVYRKTHGHKLMSKYFTENIIYMVIYLFHIWMTTFVHVRLCVIKVRAHVPASLWVCICEGNWIGAEHVDTGNQSKIFFYFAANNIKSQSNIKHKRRHTLVLTLGISTHSQSNSAWWHVWGSKKGAVLNFSRLLMCHKSHKDKRRSESKDQSGM